MFKSLDPIGSEKNDNVLVFGTLGRGSKSITFKEKDFKKELAHANAEIERVEMNGEKYVIMTYGL